MPTPNTEPVFLEREREGMREARVHSTKQVPGNDIYYELNLITDLNLALSTMQVQGNDSYLCAGCQKRPNIVS